MIQTREVITPLRIGELARVLETTTKTLRHYEKMGLIKPSHRTNSGYRVYDKSEQKNAKKIMGLRGIGLSIPEIKQLLITNSPDQSIRQRLLGILDEKIRDMDESLGILQGRRDDLDGRYLALFDTPSERDGECICSALLEECNCK